MKTLANIKSAIKRAELNVKQNEKNSAQKSALRTAIKAFNANPTEEAFRAGRGHREYHPHRRTVNDI